MLVTSLYLALLARSLRLAFQLHMHHLLWNTSASDFGAPKMSEIHVVQKHKITPVQHADIVIVAFPFPVYFGNYNLMQPLG